MLVAAEDRYREAEELLVNHEFDGAVYLLGYSAEMWLKAACMRLRGHGPLTPVKGTLAPLKNWMRSASPSVTFSDCHDLSYFSECIVALRLSQGRPLVGTLLTDLRLQIANGLYFEWIVDMRYRRSGLSAVDGWLALSQAWWIKHNWAKLL
jgi:hypothetical protein